MTIVTPTAQGWLRLLPPWALQGFAPTARLPTFCAADASACRIAFASPRCGKARSVARRRSFLPPRRLSINGHARRRRGSLRVGETLEVHRPDKLEGIIMGSVVYHRQRATPAALLRNFPGKSWRRAFRCCSRTILRVSDEYVLIVLPPTVAGMSGSVVPKQVIRFLNDPDNRALCRAKHCREINLGKAYCTGDIIAAAGGPR